jgi:hypothetical protein
MPQGQASRCILLHLPNADYVRKSFRRHSSNRHESGFLMSPNTNPSEIPATDQARILIVRFGNTGIAAALGVTYSATLTSGVTNAFCSGASCSFNPSSGAITIAGLPATLAPGQNFTVTITYTAPAAGTVSVASLIATQSCQGANFDPDTAIGGTVIDVEAVNIPTLSPFGLAMMMLALGLMALWQSRRFK